MGNEKDYLDKKIEEEKERLLEHALTRLAAMSYERAIEEINGLIEEAKRTINKLNALKSYIINVRYSDYV